jgi:hypothetical protein
MNEIEAEEWIATRIDPLAEAMEDLAGDVRQTLNQVQDRIESQAKAWDEQQRTMAEQWGEVAQMLKVQSQAAAKATRGMTWKAWLMMLPVALIVGAGAPTAYMLVQRHYAQEKKVTAYWQWFIDRRAELKPGDRKTLDRILGLQKGK